MKAMLSIVFLALFSVAYGVYVAAPVYSGYGVGYGAPIASYGYGIGSYAAAPVTYGGYGLASPYYTGLNYAGYGYGLGLLKK